MYRAPTNVSNISKQSLVQPLRGGDSANNTTINAKTTSTGSPSIAIVIEMKKTKKIHSREKERGLQPSLVALLRWERRPKYTKHHQCEQNFFFKKTFFSPMSPRAGIRSHGILLGLYWHSQKSLNQLLLVKCEYTPSEATRVQLCDLAQSYTNRASTPCASALWRPYFNSLAHLQELSFVEVLCYF